MPLIQLPAASRTPKPWKNGGGVTTDVFVWPEGAGLDSFIARVSIAEVASDGPFSTFPGIDRTTAILSGHGFDLTFPDGIAHRLTPTSDPLAYSGDRHAHSRLIAGPSTDLNLMTRRDEANHSLRRVKVNATMSLSVTGLSVLLVTEGAATISARNNNYKLGPLDALAFTTETVLEIIPARQCHFWLATFVINPE